MGLDLSKGIPVYGDFVDVRGRPWLVEINRFECRKRGQQGRTLGPGATGVNLYVFRAKPKRARFRRDDRAGACDQLRRGGHGHLACAADAHVG